MPLLQQPEPRARLPSCGVLGALGRGACGTVRSCFSRLCFPCVDLSASQAQHLPSCSPGYFQSAVCLVLMTVIAWCDGEHTQRATCLVSVMRVLFFPDIIARADLPAVQICHSSDSLSPGRGCRHGVPAEVPEDSRVLRARR